ncbi:MAG: two-component system sensor histidine kinase CreC [Verrucomicrobiales bacterium]|nr:two-component system sensor histidine kinase CreC [Verrucomicrobiales bacterium]
MSTATRSLIGFLLIVAAAFYLLLDKVMERVERQYMEAVEETMVDTVNLFAALAEQSFRSEGVRFANFGEMFTAAHRRNFEAKIYQVIKSEVEMDVYITDAQGIVLFDSRETSHMGQDYSQWRDVFLALQGKYGARSSRVREDNEDSSILYLAVPLRHDDRIVGSLTLIKPQNSVFAFRDATRKEILRTGTLALLGTGFAALLVSIWMSRPVRKLTDYARAIRRGERVSRPKLATPEMRTLGDALEGMRESLEDRKYVETYVQTLTHEMKSPVAAIRGASELLQEGDAVPLDKQQQFLDNICIETDRLQKIIDQLLALSTIESQKALADPSSLPLADLILRVCNNLEPSLQAKELVLERDFTEEINQGLKVCGEEFLLKTAIANLLQNAIEFSVRGSTIRVKLRQLMVGQNKMLSLTIRNEGPEIPDYAVERVFERFYSLKHPDTGKKSSGLGLCFVREAAELHQGKARLYNREDGEGVVAELLLPVE